MIIRALREFHYEFFDVKGMTLMGPWFTPYILLSGNWLLCYYLSHLFLVQGHYYYTVNTSKTL